MNIRKLQYLCTIAKEQNITKAAQTLFVAQPYLSSLISNIEKELGVKIFDRTVTPLQLTYEGQIYIRYAKQVIDLHHLMEKELQDVKELKSGKVSIGCPFSMGAYILPHLLPEFSLEFPNIELALQEVPASEIEQSLLRGLLDVGFSCNKPQEIGLEGVQLMSQVYKVATGPSHPFVKKYPERVLSVEDLVNEKFVSNVQGTLFRKHIEELFTRAGLAYNVLIDCRNSETAKALVSQGFGLMFLHENMIYKENDPHNLVYFSLREASPVFTIYVITNPNTYTSFAAKKFVNFTSQKFSHSEAGNQ